MRQVGDRFGRLVITAEGPRRLYNRRWHVLCDCGAVKLVEDQNLTRGLTTSCGCFKREQSGVASHSRTHGMTKTPEYRLWSGMIVRCTNQNASSWTDYGGRGIAVCDRWRHSFENFISDMGRRPSIAHSLDRRDVNGDYTPENCRWVTRGEQARNRRTTTMTWDLVNEIRGRYEHGESQVLLAKRFGLRSSYVSTLVRNRIWPDSVSP